MYTKAPKADCISDRNRDSLVAFIWFQNENEFNTTTLHSVGICVVRNVVVRNVRLHMLRE